jgi:hypothetical protein
VRVRIDFHPTFEKPMLNGEKIFTSRLKQKGKPGDVFQAFGKWFVLEKVERLSLQVVAEFLYEKEGCSSRRDFIRVWTKRIGHAFRERQMVYVHRFRMLGEDVKFRGNPLWEVGMETCIECGAAVFDEPVHIAFHEKVDRGGVT